MYELLLAAASWLHLIATVAWIGGIAFILFIAMPSAKKVLGLEASKLMGEISKRFTPVANYSIGLLVLTGTIMAVINYRTSAHATPEKNWSIVLAVKLILVLSMIIIHFYRGWILAPKIIGTETEQKRAAMQKLSINLVKTNFGLGLAVLLLSAMIGIM